MEPLAEVILQGGIGVEQINRLIMSVLLVGARILSFLTVAPFFGKRGMSRNVRVGLMFALSIIMIPQTFDALQNDDVLRNAFVGLMFKEMAIGLILGMLVWMPVRGIEFAGTLMDTQRGSTTAQDFDVIFNAQTTPTAILLAQLFSGFFFATGGFLLVQMIIFDSFTIWPTTSALPPLRDDAAYLFIKFSGILIFTSVVFALPISGFMFLADIGIAFVARSAPTLNALTFGMPVKSAILLIMLYFYMDYAYPSIMDTFTNALSLTEALFKSER